MSTMAKKVFIDGKAGTTGLRIYERLEKRSDILLQTLSDAERKDPARRKEATQLLRYCLSVSSGCRRRGSGGDAGKSGGDGDRYLRPPTGHPPAGLTGFRSSLRNLPEGFQNPAELPYRDAMLAALLRWSIRL